MNRFHSYRVFGSALLLLALAWFASCDILESDNGPDGMIQSAGGYFYLLDRTSVEIVQLDASMRETRRWSTLPVTSDTSLQGLAFDGTYLWLSSAGAADMIYQVDLGGDTLATVKSFQAPPLGSGTIRDIAWDGTSLWAINSGSTTNRIPPTLYRLNPADGSILNEYVVPTPEPRGLTYVPANGDAYGRGAEMGLYYTDVTNNRIYKFRTDRPQFDSAFTSPTPPRGVSYIYPAGLAFDGQSFWLVNSSNTADHLYKLTYNGTVLYRFDLPYTSPGPIAWSKTDVRVPVSLSLSAVLPNTANRGANMLVEIFGSGFRPGPYLAANFGDSTTVSTLQFVSSTLLRANVGIGRLAPYAKRNVTVTNGDGRVVVGDSLFEVTPVPGIPGHLYLADQQTGGYTVHKVRINDTTVVRSWGTTSVSAGSPQGLAYDGTNLWLCASGSDKRIYKIDTTGSLAGLSSIAAPPTAGTLRGIAWNNGTMWLAVSGTGSAKIYNLNPTTGAVLDSINTPGIEPRGIVFVNGQIYCNDTSLDSVYVYNTLNARWTGAFATPTPPGGTTGNRFATGLTWDGTNFWIANSTNNFDHVFRLSATGTILQYFTAPGVGLAQLSGLVYTPN